MFFITVSIKRSYRQTSLVMPVFRELQRIWHPGSAIERLFPVLSAPRFYPERAVFLGKCAVSMAEGASKFLPELPKLVYSTLPEHKGDKIKNVEYLWGTHPNQSLLNVKNSKRAAEWLKSTRGDLLAFISGGTSALISSPPAPWKLGEVVRIENSLLKAGAPIEKINIVRMAFSNLRAGGMAELVKPYPVQSFIWCDVPPKLYKIVGSAPFWNNGKFPGTSPREILEEYGIASPRAIPEKKNFKPAKGSKAIKLADGEMFAGDFVKRLKAKNISAKIINIEEGTSAEKASEKIAGIAKNSKRPCVLVGSGEYPVAVKGDGKGGRCSHLAALMTKELYDQKKWFFAAIATDGEDGGGGGCGAHVCDEKLPEKNKLNKAIIECRTADLFEETGSLIPGKPTGNNLRDLWFLSLEG
jgi:glycerate 2-kinase